MKKARWLTFSGAALLALLLAAQARPAARPSPKPPAAPASPGLWPVYEQSLAGAKYIDLTHTVTPSIPVWHGFGPSHFGPALNPASGKPYTYAEDGFEATRYDLATESWLMHHGYTQAEGVAHLDQVPETGCLVTVGYPKLRGGTGGYARYVAICPADWKYGVSVGQVPEAPLPRSDKVLAWDPALGVRVRK